MPDHGLWMLGGWLTMLLLGLAALLLLIFAAKQFLGKRPPAARELLDQAYARGELSRDEYCEQRDDPTEH